MAGQASNEVRTAATAPPMLARRTAWRADAYRAWDSVCELIRGSTTLPMAPMAGEAINAHVLATAYTPSDVGAAATESAIWSILTFVIDGMTQAALGIA